MTRPGKLVAAVAMVMTWMASAHAQRAVTPTQWNDSPNPSAPYGTCWNGAGKEMMRSLLLGAVDETLANVLAITILSCRGFTGGANGKVSCPAGSPYGYCLFVPNDGGGNAIRLGVLKADRTTDPEAPYAGCGAGAHPQRKLDLLLAAGRDPRRISGIVTLSCRPATGTRQPVVELPCPAGPNPYGYCLRTSNDGNNLAVAVGVVYANGPGDSYGLYGECNAVAYGNQRGFLRKSTLVERVGRSPAQAASIYLIACTERRDGGPLAVVACDPLYERLGWKYSYCIHGVDRLNNEVWAGVLARP